MATWPGLGVSAVVVVATGEAEETGVFWYFGPAVSINHQSKEMKYNELVGCFFFQAITGWCK
jgi:hypothetical protein